MKSLALFPLFAVIAFLFLGDNAHASADTVTYEAKEYALDKDQYAKFPLPLSEYDAEEGANPEWGIWEKLKYRATIAIPGTSIGGFNIVATIIFLCAIIHTFLSGFFVKMAHHHEEQHRKHITENQLTAEHKPHEDARDHVSFKANLFHFLGEVEAIFGIWVLALGLAVLWFFGINGDGLWAGIKQVEYYIGKDVNFTEPIFVVIIMAIAATRPVVRFAEALVDKVAKIFGGRPAAWWLSALTITPILGSFITEPAAMTIAAMLLAKKFFDLKPSNKFAYATLGLLFVNISVGGTLTHFAAPPVLMIAEKWNFGMGFMFLNFGWKAVVGIVISNILYFQYFKKEFANMGRKESGDLNQPLRWVEREDPIPAWITLVHILFLAFTVVTAHYQMVFILGFLFFIGFTQATGHHQNDVDMKSPILVGFFLAGLVIHGGCQGWWISVLLTSIDSEWLLMIGATLLTAFNDNAAITYLASQAPGLPIISKYAVLAGAVTGGGLTVIANAPNPAGQSVLGRYFKGGVVPLNLAKAALIPTLIMGACFMLLPSSGMHEDPKEVKTEEVEKDH